MIDQIYCSMEVKRISTSEKQKRKFNLCSKHGPIQPALDTKMVMVNLSDRQLIMDETAVSVKEFAVMPKVLPVEDVATNIETGI